MTARYYGFNPPFFLDGRGVMARQEDVRLIKNDILQLLFTLPGERVHRPDFGTPLRTAVFDPMTPYNVNKLKQDIRVALENEEPRLTKTVVYVDSDPDKQLVRVRITGELSFDPNIKLELETSIMAPGATIT